jgi:Fe-S cluster assembly protein SufD
MKIIKRYDHPGKWEVVLPFAKTGEDKEWMGIIDARQPGEYEIIVTAEHLVPKTKGRITVRAVCGVDAHVKIKGIIRINKKAQETDDFLELRVLMLGKTARAIVEPELEIEANNVKASHAASVGQVDEEQVMYLMSRGLSRDRAQEQIVNGWLGV